MFTGIVEAVGRIDSAEGASDGLRLAVSAGALDVSDVRIGDSVAVAGCCLTVVAIEGSSLSFDVSAETLRCTSGLDRAREVNLEKALRFGDRLGGHLLTGHIDGVGTVIRIESTANPDGVDLEIEAPSALARFIAAKGSIAVDGVSLTVNVVSNRRFSVHLIPHTLQVTTLRALIPGSEVNLEVDIVARYLERMAGYKR
ncbi:MAG TPA: riboflavin synthase [Casimicrobiaceae bacterium]|nr:riboflavin synthase [Casimicrobiaceae bacterium]